MKVLTFKPGTKIITRKHNLRSWAKDYLDVEGVVVGAGDKPGWIKIKVKLHTFDVVPAEIELVKPIKLKSFSAWK
jgi:hypothetical protein